MFVVATINVYQRFFAIIIGQTDTDSPSILSLLFTQNCHKKMHRGTKMDWLVGMATRPSMVTMRYHTPGA